MADVSEGEGSDSRARRLRLAATLRRLRDLSGLSGRELAHRVQISQSKVSRIESGVTMPSLPEVQRWAEAVDAPLDTRERLADLTQAAVYESHAWRTALQGKPHLQDDFQERESSVRLVRNFQCAVIPGLLQTAAYARAVFAMSVLPYEKEDLAAATASRLFRQEALYEGDRRFDFLITEAALRWRPSSPAQLLAQWDRLASVSTLDNVSIGLIPHGRQSTVLPLHGFVIYGPVYGGDDDTAETFVEVETNHAKLTIPDFDITLYEKQWSLLTEMAIFDDAAREFLTELATEVRTEMS
ncbi:helix-turn-helix transcriptional regulator [Acrocarpospora sp. B8E8]|uniref:helix-turn-helix domain-containing protein n=1 Tax=Acrocarpospora sp. B8E8 TaxID=3153572 RepID=UPI00325E355D